MYGFSGRKPTLFRARALGTRMPNIEAVPVLGVTRPINTFSVVVFPAPFGPTKPKMSPRSTSKLTSRTAGTRRMKKPCR